MPVTWDEAAYQRAYNYPGGLTYGLEWARRVEGPHDLSTFNFHRNRFRSVGAAIPGVGPKAHILIVGCGFGYSVAEALRLGYANTRGTDISPYIQANKYTQMDDPAVADRVLDIDVTAPDAADQFRAAGAGNNQGKFAYILTEFVVESFDPDTESAEFQAFLDGLDALKINPPANVIHLLAGRQAPPYDQKHDETLGLTWQSLEEWAAVRPAHYWVDVHRGIENWQGGQ